MGGWVPDFTKLMQSHLPTKVEAEVEDELGNLDITKTETESLPTNHSSHLRNKHMEDIESKTVANNMADLIVHLEMGSNNQGKTQINDEEGLDYSDDEEIDYKEDTEISDENQGEFYCLRETRKKSKTTMENLSRLPNKCLHVIDKALSYLCGLMNDTEQIDGENEKLLEMKKETVSILSNEMRRCHQMKKEKIVLKCHHEESELSMNLKDVLNATSDQFNVRNNATETVKKI